MNSLVVARHPRRIVGVVAPVPDADSRVLEDELDWLELHGVAVERVDPVEGDSALDSCPEAARVWHQAGMAALPLVLVDGRLATQGHVPSRRELVHLVKDDASPATARWLAAIGAAAAIGAPEAIEQARSAAMAVGIANPDIDAAEAEGRHYAAR